MWIKSDASPERSGRRHGAGADLLFALSGIQKLVTKNAPWAPLQRAFRLDGSSMSATGTAVSVKKSCALTIAWRRYAAPSLHAYAPAEENLTDQA